MTDLNLLHTFVLLAAAVPFFHAAISDVRRYAIPHICTLALLALYPLHVWLASVDINVIASVIVAATAFAICFTFFALNRLGGGDVKLITAAALWAGPALIGEFTMIMAFAGGALSLLYLTHFHVAPALGFDIAGMRGYRNSMAIKLPYGVAIATGGFWVLLQLAQ